MDIGYRARIRLVKTAARIAPKHQVRLFQSKLNPRRHRWLTGGLWEEMGKFQLAFMVSQGLQPEHLLLDVGCGGLRGGVHFVRYLEPGHYFGVDANESFLKAGAKELDMAGIADKGATLVRDDQFDFSRVGGGFDFAIAQSVFTHLPFNAIIRCLGEAEKALRPGGKFYATYFPKPTPRLSIDPVEIKGRPVYIDRDPFCYESDMFRWAVEGSQLAFTLVGDWGHPRGQEMLLFTKQP